MQLPRLKLPVLQKSVTCLGKDYCGSCSLHKSKGGRCEGCTDQHRAQLGDNFASCFQDCHNCAGFKTLYTAICCKSPLKDLYLTAVTKGAAGYNHPKYTYEERPAVAFKTKAILYIASSVNTVTGGGRVLPISPEVVAVNLTRVWSKNGFYTEDLKDYLSLSKSTKLLLMTMCIDDLLEDGWRTEMYADPDLFGRHGIDMWMPLSFSSYPSEARMHQLYQFYRTLYATEKSHAWWTTGDHFMGSGLEIDDLYLECAAKIPQVVFNTQFISDEASMRHHLHLLRHAHAITPPHVSFWLVGSATPTFVHNVRAQTGSRDLYFLSPRPLMVTAKGQKLLASGKTAPDPADKLTLLSRNYETFARVVAEYGQCR